ATRLQRASALEMAQAELAACTRKGCAQAPQLSLLVGSLLLSRGEPREALVQLRRHPAPPLLAPYRSFDIGEALFYTRDFRGAASASTGISGGPARPSRGPPGRRGRWRTVRSAGAGRRWCGPGRPVRLSRWSSELWEPSEAPSWFRRARRPGQPSETSSGPRR